MMFHRFSLTALMALASAVSMTACGTPPKDLDLSLQHASVQQRFMVRMEPPASGPAINQMHAWRVLVSGWSRAGHYGHV